MPNMFSKLAPDASTEMVKPQTDVNRQNASMLIDAGERHLARSPIGPALPGGPSRSWHCE
jgi:hypothetical protein